MNKIFLWIRSVRAPFMTATLVPVLVGTSLAVKDHAFSWQLFLEVLVGVLLLHAGTNLANDYFDDRSGTDRINQSPTPFSGGSRVIQQGEVAPKTMLLASLVCFAIGAAIGLHLASITPGFTILILGAVGIISGFFYTAPPFRFAARGFGEFLVGLNFGPLVVIGTYYALAHRISSEILFASLPVGLLITLVLLLNEFPDFEADRQAGKHNLVVRFGKKKAIKLYSFLLLTPYLCLLLGVLLKLFSALALLPLLTLPLAFKAWRIASTNFEDTAKLIPAMAQTIQLHLFTGLLLAASFFLEAIF